MATIVNIIAQKVEFTDGSTVDVPWIMTPRHGGTEITLQLDTSRKSLTFSLDVTKKQFIDGINILQIQAWRLGGRLEGDRPRMVPYEGA